MASSYGRAVTASPFSAHMDWVKSDVPVTAPAGKRHTGCNRADDRRWNNFLSHLTAYVAEFPLDTLRSTYVADDGYKLGEWVGTYRSAHRKKALGPEQVRTLDAVPGWDWRHPFQQLWDEGIAALTSFSQREGHCSVPRTHIENGHALGLWVDNKRKNHRNGTLTAAQIGQLESFPAWDWGPYDDRWWPDFEIFKSHVLGGGCADPEPGLVVDGLELHAWCRQQHSRHRRGTMSAGAVAALESVPGWSWKTNNFVRQRQVSAVSAYRRFVRREGHGKVPVGHAERKFQLGPYLANARYRLKQGGPSEDLSLLLDSVSTDWRQPLPGSGTIGKETGKAVSRYGRFIAREGHGRVPSEHVEWGFKLGIFLVNARQRSRRGTLPDRTQELLDSVSTDWRAGTWQPDGQTSRLQVSHKPLF